MTQLNLMDCKWCQREQKVVLDAMRGRVFFTSDDLRAVVTVQPEQVNLFGVLMAKLRCSGVIEEVGRVRSKRREANGRKVSAWKVV